MTLLSKTLDFLFCPFQFQFPPRSEPVETAPIPVVYGTVRKPLIASLLGFHSGGFTGKTPPLRPGEVVIEATRPSAPAWAFYLTLERHVLAAVPAHTAEHVVTKAQIAAQLDVPAEVVGAVLRTLKEAGKVRVGVAYNSDTGAPQGSGYFRTPPADQGAA